MGQVLKHIANKSSCLLLFLGCTQAGAAVYSYEPGLLESTWQVAPPHPLSCSMSQEIPLYGTAIFLQNAGKQPAFKMDVLRAMPQAGKGRLMAIPPLWDTEKQQSVHSTIKIYQGATPVRLAANDASWMLGQLERGWSPAVKHAGWHSHKDTVVAKLSSVRFAPAYASYMQCLQQLLPYGYDQIKSSVIYYSGGSVELSARDRTVLERIIKYVKVDPKVSMIVLKGYTDSVGTRRGNYVLSIERLRVIQKYLMDRGIAEKMIDATAYGERRPKASNATAAGRAQNRRTDIFVRR